MQVRELIGQVIECGPGTTLSEAARTMSDAGIGAIIVKDQGAMAGILSERDVLQAAGEGCDLKAEIAADWMTTEVGSVRESTDVSEAATWLLGAGYRHLPITDTMGDVIGVVSIKDVLWAVVDAAEARQS
jgi:CBS domain-containing protein